MVGTKTIGAKSTFVDQFAAQLNIFTHGVLDSISVHKIFPLLVNKGEIAYLTLKIFGANSLLLVGSVALYHEAILPGLSRLRSSMIMDNMLKVEGTIENQLEQSGVTRILFYSLIVIPIYLMCYSCSVIWYQNLADGMHKVKKVTSSTPLVKAVVDGTYATLAWLFIFIQVQLLGTVIPLVLSNILPYLIGSSSSSERIGQQSTETGWRWFFQSLTPFLRSCIILCVSNGILLSQAMGLFLLSVLYGWYGFDPHWIAANIDPDTRFSIIEKHWAYFLGFGAPYVVLVKCTSFFVGYGWFLALFPFCIMLGGTCDYASPYKTQLQPMPSLRIFKVAQMWTLAALKMIGKNTKTSEKSAVPAKLKKSL